MCLYMKYLFPMCGFLPTVGCSMEGRQELETEAIHEDFKGELLHKLNELRETKIFCDTTIRAEGQDFAAHKCVLSAASAYFRAMFTSQMNETVNSVVELQEASTTISDVIQFIYTGKASIDSSNAQDLVMIADYLIIPSLKTKASLFLQGTVNASNCLALEAFASQYNCESLKQVAVSYKIENFVAVAKSEDFKELDSQKVKEVVCKDEVNVSEEEQVYQAVISWVKHDLSCRECLLPELMKYVRLFSISENNLRNILVEDLVSKNPACTGMVTNALDFILRPNRYQGTQPKPRLSLEKYVVLTGGVSGYGYKKDTLCFELSTRTWVSLPSMPYFCSEGGSAVCNGKFYILGEDIYHDSPSVLCCFDPEQRNWSSSDITLNVRDFSATCYDKELYFIGGNDRYELHADVQIYNPALHRWRQAASMQTRRASHCAVVLHNHIYVIGGCDSEVCLNSVECYNPLTDQWAEVSSMSKVRRCASAATVCQKILVVGGFVDMSDVIEPSCEIFELSTNQWSMVSSPGVPRAAGSAVTVDDMVYLFGGEDETEYLDTVECFDVRSNEWCKIANMPNCRSFMQASLIKLPEKLVLQS